MSGNLLTCKALALPPQNFVKNIRRMQRSLAGDKEFGGACRNERAHHPGWVYLVTKTAGLYVAFDAETRQAAGTALPRLVLSLSPEAPATRGGGLPPPFSWFVALRGMPRRAPEDA
jgi:hypothetical protein